MNKLLCALSAVMAAPVASAHPGHGIPGTVSHDLQHQFWIFATLVVVGALLLSADKVVALCGKQRKRTDRDNY